MTTISKDILEYNLTQKEADQPICTILAEEITNQLPDAVNKIWHSHPVWFIKDNPIVGYSRQKPGIRLMFWSGQDFDEPNLSVHGKKFRDASIFFTDASEIDKSDLRRWLEKSKSVQWDYRNLIRRKGQLERLK